MPNSARSERKLERVDDGNVRARLLVTIDYAVGWAGVEVRVFEVYRPKGSKQPTRYVVECWAEHPDRVNNPGRYCGMRRGGLVDLEDAIAIADEWIPQAFRVAGIDSA